MPNEARLNLDGVVDAGLGAQPTLGLAAAADRVGAEPADQRLRQPGGPQPGRVVPPRIAGTQSAPRRRHVRRVRRAWE